MAAPVDPVTVGRITTVHGVRGWVKVHSATEPQDNIIGYQPWWICRKGEWLSLQVDQHRVTQKGLICHIKGLDDRDEARNLCQQDVLVEKSSLAALEEGEYYWHQLQGLQVIANWQGQTHNLGTVSSILPTGANDVLVVKGSEHSLDKQERLIPYIDQVVTHVDLEKATIQVDWDPEF